MWRCLFEFNDHKALIVGYNLFQELIEIAPESGEDDPARCHQSDPHLARQKSSVIQYRYPVIYHRALPWLGPCELSGRQYATVSAHYLA